MVPCRNSWGKVMEKGKEKAYIKGFLVEALINAMPLNAATAVVDRVLLSEFSLNMLGAGFFRDEEGRI